MSEQKIDPNHIGEEFQKCTKYAPEGLHAGARWKGSIRPYKHYPSSLSRVGLPRPKSANGPGLWDAMKARRSVRSYGSRAVEREELSQLLWALQGITARVHGHNLRTTPSAGALFPVETYLVAHNVRSLEQGLYHYDVIGHALTRLKSGDLRSRIAAAALDQEMCADAAVVFMWTAIIGRSAQKYAQRAYRYIYLDAGHIAQNLALASVALGLGSCQIGALFDDEVNAILGVDGYRETVVYMSSVGPLP